ncbi:MAG TPA: hypothetical protein VHT97_13615 [Acidimicrobiales bacterium]|nr:hypothetical protein [Acidimicrobiales bacterium]
MTRQQKIVPVVVLFVIVVSVLWSLIPFKFASVVDCGAPLLGAHPKNSAPGTSFINPEVDCRSKGKSRLSVSAVAAFLAVLAGTAIISLKPISSSCAAGDHDDCREWWLAVALGDAGTGLSCQCECHAGVF